MVKSRFFAVLLSIFSLVASSAQAITIDSFEGDFLDLVLSGEVKSVSSSASSAIGGMRKLRFQALDGFLQVSIKKGIFGHSQPVTGTGNTTITWDANQAPLLNSTGLGGLDFSQDGGQAIAIDIREFDFPSLKPVVLVVTIFDASDTTGNSSSTASLTLTSAVNVTSRFLIPFSSFVKNGSNGPANFSKVGAVTLQVVGNDPAIDLSIDWIGTDGKCAILPNAQGRVIDQCGVCGGDNSSCADCRGVPNGPDVPGANCDSGELGVCKPGAYSKTCRCERKVQPSSDLCDGLDNNCDGSVDESFPLLNQTCGIGNSGCTEQGVYRCDSSGQMFCDAVLLQAKVDVCEKSRGCDNVPGSGLAVDSCGICGGNGTSCLDCKGVAFGKSALDRCGVCGGDGSSCLKCREENLFALLTQLDQGAKLQENVLKKIYLRVDRLTKNRKVRAKTAQLRKEAHRLQIRNWTLSWTVPAVVTLCDNAVLCNAISHDAIISEYRVHNDELLKMTVDAVALLDSIAGKATLVGQQLLGEGTGIHDNNAKLVATVPTTHSSCN